MKKQKREQGYKLLPTPHLCRRPCTATKPNRRRRTPQPKLAPLLPSRSSEPSPTSPLYEEKKKSSEERCEIESKEKEKKTREERKKLNQPRADKGDETEQIKMKNTEWMEARRRRKLRWEKKWRKEKKNERKKTDEGRREEWRHGVKKKRRKCPVKWSTKEDQAVNKSKPRGSSGISKKKSAWAIDQAQKPKLIQTPTWPMFIC